MFDRAGLAISLPAGELRQAKLARSVFELDELAQIPVSEGLRLAVDLVVATAAALGAPVRFIARPEIFTHGDSLSWLREQLGGARDHLCMSDGSCVRLVPTLRNHVFFFDLATRSHAEALRRLFLRAPEIFAGVETQVSSGFRTRVEGSRWIRPPTTLLHAQVTRVLESARLLPFVFDRRSIELSAHRCVALAEAPPPDRRETRRATYIPLTETALADVGFMRIVAARVARAFFDRAACVYLGLPRLPGERSSLLARVCATLEGLRDAAGDGLPRTPANAVFLVGGALPAEAIDGVESELMLHQSAPIWRESRADLDAFDAIGVFAPREGGDEAGLMDVVARMSRNEPRLTQYDLDG
ncbi:MAG: hypothetical protein ABSG83_13545 [Roseiarcus sp.]|jgi:hypothetical protein